MPRKRLIETILNYDASEELKEIGVVDIGRG